MSLKGTYPASPSGRFSVVGSIPVPHPYTLGAKHVIFGADRGGTLTPAIMEEAERAGIVCEACKGKLKLAEHESALLVSCKVDFKENKEAKEEAETWLKSIVEESIKNGYVGFAFRKDFP